MPAWRGPATICKNRRGSTSRSARTAPCGRSNSVFLLLAILHQEAGRVVDSGHISADVFAEYLRVLSDEPACTACARIIARAPASISSTTRPTGIVGSIVAAGAVGRAERDLESIRQARGVAAIRLAGSRPRDCVGALFGRRGAGGGLASLTAFLTAHPARQSIAYHRNEFSVLG